MQKGIVQRIIPNGMVAVELESGGKTMARNSHNVSISEGSIVHVDNREIVQLVTYKADIWRRATEEEVEQIVTALDQQSLKNQMIFKDALFIDHLSDEFELVEQVLNGVVGEDRARELLHVSF